MKIFFTKLRSYAAIEGNKSFTKGSKLFCEIKKRGSQLCGKEDAIVQTKKWPLFSEEPFHNKHF